MTSQFVICPFIHLPSVRLGGELLSEAPATRMDFALGIFSWIRYHKVFGRRTAEHRSSPAQARGTGECFPALEDLVFFVVISV